MITRNEYLFCDKLDPTLIQYIHKNYDRTLCYECLKIINENFNISVFNLKPVNTARK
jgi:hypothetical protein